MREWWREKIGIYVKRFLALFSLLCLSKRFEFLVSVIYRIVIQMTASDFGRIAEKWREWWKTWWALIEESSAKARLIYQKLWAFFLRKYQTTITFNYILNWWLNKNIHAHKYHRILVSTLCCLSVAKHIAPSPWQKIFCGNRKIYTNSSWDEMRSQREKKNCIENCWARATKPKNPLFYPLRVFLLVCHIIDVGPHVQQWQVLLNMEKLGWKWFEG